MPTPVMGIADTHTHPCSHLGFGGMVWGSPAAWGDQSFEDLSGLTPCDGATHGGHLQVFGLDVFLPWLGNTDVTRTVFAGLETLGGGVHGPDGPPAFLHWPDFAEGVHQQYHLRYIYRAFKLGNLAVLSALAVSNRLLSRFMANGSPQSDAAAVQAQIAAIKALVASVDWMEIAPDPSRIRDINSRGKLAVILGVEVDQIESLVGAPVDAQKTDWVAPFVDQLVGLGVSQITPLHLADNAFGGFAVYEDLFASSSRDATGAWPAVQLDASIDFKLAWQQLEFVGAPIQVLPATPTFPPANLGYDRSVVGSGHRNVRGLTPAGTTLLCELMKRGMLIDIDHMSQDTASAALQLAAKFKYPLLSSHTAIRHVAFRDSDPLAWAPSPSIGGAPIRLGPTPSERALTDDAVVALAGLGGMLSPGTAGAGNVNLKPDPNAADLPFSQIDVPAGTTIGWAVTYLEAVRMWRLANAGTPRVGLGTDFTLTPSCGPRFGRRAGARPGLDIAGPRPAPAPPLLYQGDQGAGQDALPRYAVAVGSPSPTRSYDFNKDGFAHYGLLPDYLADLRTIGLTEDQLSPLLSSGESLTAMWEDCLAASSSVAAGCP